MSDFVGGVAVGFLSGYFSGRFLDRDRERRTKRRERSRNIFEPLHLQLTEARVQITNFERPNALNYDFWHQLNLPLRIIALPPGLQQRLREFYSDIVPNYEASWRVVNEHGVAQILAAWSLKLGTDPDLKNLQVFPKYYRFLISPEFRPALLELKNPRILPLWNKVTDQDALNVIGLTVDQFLKQLWDEAQAEPTFQAAQNARQSALRVLSEAIPLIREHIIE